MHKGDILGVPRPLVDRGWPFRQPTQEEVDDIIDLHVREKGMDMAVAERHVGEEFAVVLDEFVPDDEGYHGKVAIAFADKVDNFAVYYWPEGKIEILHEQGSPL